MDCGRFLRELLLLSSLVVVVRVQRRFVDYARHSRSTDRRNRIEKWEIDVENEPPERTGGNLASHKPLIWEKTLVDVISQCVTIIRGVSTEIKSMIIMRTITKKYPMTSNESIEHEIILFRMISDSLINTLTFSYNTCNFFFNNNPFTYLTIHYNQHNR